MRIKLLATLLLAIAFGQSAWALTPIEVLSRAHSHNDYEQKHPLQDALDNGLTSVEADIWLRDGDVWISHIGLPGGWKGTLRDLYLDPMQKLVDARGSIYGDGRQVYLWLDIKDGNPQLLPLLNRQLSRYGMMSIFTDRRDVIRPVIAILTGNAKSKEKYVNERRVRWAVRDSNDYRPSDPPTDGKWRWYAVKWSHILSWDGKGQPRPEERERLARMVADIHSKNRRLRIWKGPETRAAWRLCLELGVDQVSTDHLADYHKFAESFP